MEKIDYFSTAPDPRVKGHCKHKLSDILIIAIATYLCGGDDYASMYEFCKHWRWVAEAVGRTTHLTHTPTYFQHGSMNTPSVLRLRWWKRRAMKSPPSPMCLTALTSQEPWWVSMPWERKPILLREDCGIGGRLCLSSKKESQTLIWGRKGCLYRLLHTVYIQHIG